MKPIVLGSLLLGSALASPRRIPKGVDVDASRPLLEKRQSSASSPQSLPLGDAARFAVFGFTGIATVPGTADRIITGDIGVAPIAITAITGFGAVTNGQRDQPYVAGAIYGPDSSSEAHDDILAAYTIGSAPYPDFTTFLPGTELGGLTLTPGVYRWNSALQLSVGQTLTLDGDCGDVFIFQATGSITTGTGSSVVLLKTLTSSTVYWIGSTNLVTGVDSIFAGMILTYTNVVIAGTLNGAVYSQTEVALHGATINLPLSEDICPLMHQGGKSTTGKNSDCSGDKFYDQATDHCYNCQPFSWNTYSNGCRECPKGQYFTGNKGQCTLCGDIDSNAATCLPITGKALTCLKDTTLNVQGVCSK